VIPIFDSNILIDCIKGIEPATKEILDYSYRSISIITWIEVLAGARNAQEELLIKKFMGDYFSIIPLDDQIAELASAVRREKKLKLPDAVILATAQHKNTLLVTRNSKDFFHKFPNVRIPYSLH